MSVIDDLIVRLGFDAQGLIPAIAQQFDTREVLMLAWMNAESLRQTLESGEICYWSRSRGTLWRKGESSGQFQRLIALHVDCDEDAILLEVDQHGVACHTGRRSCFFHTVTPEGIVVSQEVIVDPGSLYNRNT